MTFPSNWRKSLSEGHHFSENFSSAIYQDGFAVKFRLKNLPANSKSGDDQVSLNGIEMMSSNNK